MAVVGIIHLTSIANAPLSTLTPATTLLSHLSDLFPTQIHRPFHLDHRLFVSTSSLLPQAENKRDFTQFFSSSHNPGKTFVGTLSTVEKGNGLSIVTIPTSASLDPFIALLTQKLQPQWAPRQSVALENGATVVLPITDDLEWKISIGDLRLAQSRVSGSAAGQSRGIILEIQCESIDKGTGLYLDLDREEDRKKYETLFRNVLKGLFRNVKLDLKLADVKIYLTKTPGSKPAHEDSDATEQAGKETPRQQQWQKKPQDSEIPKLYMDVLRGSKG